MAKPFILGKGLISLIPKKTPIINPPVVTPVVTSAIEVGDVIKQLITDKIVANPEQPRQHFDHGNLEELIASIKIHGILQPLIVSPVGVDQWQLIAGERRWRAAKILGLEKVPAIIRNVSQQQKLELSLVENIQRQNLNPIEEALAFQRLHDEFNLTQEEIAKKVGKSRPQIANTMRLLELVPAIQQALEQGTITLGHAKVILSLDNREEQEKFFRSILREGLNVREASWGAKRVKAKHLGKAAVQSIELKVFEDQLRSSLGTKVKVKQTGKVIKIEIECYSTEELRVIIEKLLV